MLLRSLSADFLKISSKGIWLLIVLAPIGLVAMQALNFGLRFDYLTKVYADDLWGGLLENISMFVPIALYLGCTLVSSMVAGVEHHMSSWKQLLALPISRYVVFGGKIILCFLLMSVSCLLLSICTIILGLIFGFGTPIPWTDTLRLGFFPYFTALPILALQVWLSITFRNQTLPVSLGIVAAIVSPFTLQLPAWFPLNWPVFGYAGPNEAWFIMSGIASGFIMLLIGMFHFNRKDVD